MYQIVLYKNSLCFPDFKMLSYYFRSFFVNLFKSNLWLSRLLISFLGVTYKKPPGGFTVN